MWKNSHEEYVELLMSGIDVKTGLITRFKSKGLRFFPEEDFFFSKKVVFFDKIDACCKFFDVLSDTHKCLFSQNGQLNDVAKVEYTFHKETKFNFCFEKIKQEIKQKINEIEKPFLRAPFKTIHINKPMGEIDRESSLSFFSEAFSLSNEEMATMCNYLVLNDCMMISQIEINHNSMEFKIKGHQYFQEFNCFSGGEQKMIYLDFCFQIAKTLSEFQPVIVFLNLTKFSALDRSNTENVLNTFLNDSNFQTFISCNEWQYKLVSPDFTQKIHINNGLKESDYYSQ